MENQQESEMTYESRLAKWERLNSIYLRAYSLAFWGPIFLQCAGVSPTLNPFWEPGQWGWGLLPGTFGLLFGIHHFSKPLPSRPALAGDGDKRKRNLVAAIYTVIPLALLVRSLANLLGLVTPF